METQETIKAVFNQNTIISAIVIVIGICTLITVLGNAKESIGKLKGNAPSMNDVQKFLQNDKNRLDGHEDRIKSLEKGQKIMMKGVMALIDHELNADNASSLAEAKQTIYNYLTED